jgi:two-component system LytT family sensor kinase
MKFSQLIKRQFRVAAYSSPAISALSVTPVFMLSRIGFPFYPWMIVIFTLLVFLIWAVNIWIYTFAGSRFKRYLISYLFCMSLTLFVFHHYSVHFGDQRFSSNNGGMHFHLIALLAVDTVILILQDLVVTREKNAAIELENSRLRMRNVEAMNLQLKQQVQPHFLFNSLSALKSLIGHSPEQAGEYLVRLSGFLRASMSSHAMSVVLVGRELELCVDYLEMQQIRFGDALRFSVDVPDLVREREYVPVFSLQLLIENAIKHNVLTRERPLSIRVMYADGAIRVANNLQKMPGAGAPAGEARAPAGEAGANVGEARGNLGDRAVSEGTGLVNLRERYRALTGDPVLIEEGEHEFSVTIKVFDYEGSDH